MSAGESRLPARWSRTAVYQPASKVFHLSHLRQLRGSEQVAAVCYRIRNGSVEFLLVQTGGGRWTFPKGSAEPGLTTAQAAALEAFEEAGVHGRMEQAPFGRYVRRKSGKASSPSSVDIVTTAHLCEVLWLEPPQESGRTPTWFSIEKAKRRLCEDRPAEYGAELALVIDRAAERILKLRNRARALNAAKSKLIDIESISGDIVSTKRPR
jgi:8-oxo-dGTP pyrophosphatase MutT (NUDIX family)